MLLQVKTYFKPSLQCTVQNIIYVLFTKFINGTDIPPNRYILFFLALLNYTEKYLM